MLQERQTYIDSWLDALITGLQAVQVGKAIQVDILEEPDPLVFEPVEKGVWLSYRAMAIEVESVEAFHGCSTSGSDHASPETCGGEGMGA